MLLLPLFTAASNLSPLMYQANISVMEFKLLGKRRANIEGIKLKGFQNSLEKALTHAHIKKENLRAFSVPMIDYVRKVKL